MNKISGASEDVGTLYFDSSELEKDDYVSRTKIGTLKFIPEEPGTYEVDFSIFEDEDAETVLASGTLTIPNSVSFGRRADVPIHKGLVAVGLMRMSAFFHVLLSSAHSRLSFSFRNTVFSTEDAPLRANAL